MSCNSSTVIIYVQYHFCLDNTLFVHVILLGEIQYLPYGSYINYRYRRYLLPLPVGTVFTILVGAFLQFPAENSFPLSDRPKIIVFLRNRGCWFRIWFWFARKHFSFGDIAIYSSKSDKLFAISSNKITYIFN